MDKINRMEEEDEDDYNVDDDMNDDSKAVELQPMYGRGNAKSGQKNAYLKWNASTVFETVMYLCAHLT